MTISDLCCTTADKIDIVHNEREFIAKLNELIEFWEVTPEKVEFEVKPA
jgi:hypothetical protein